MGRLTHFFHELRRRRVFRVTALYIFGAWVVLQVATLAFPPFDIPESAIGYVWIATILGFPIALVFGWRYDLVNGQIVRTKVADDSPDLSLQHADYGILVAFVLATIAITIGIVWEINSTRSLVSTQQQYASPDPASIAVLPFVNISDDPSNEYFTDGVSEELLNVLSKVPDLKVISRTSAFSFKGLGLDIPTIAARLNVAHILEGSVRKDGHRIRITAQLIDASSDTHIWSDSYDRSLGDVFAIQDEIAAAVVREVTGRLPVQEPSTYETDPKAYDLYLMAGYILRQPVSDRALRAEKLLKDALEIDPEFAWAWAQLSVVYDMETTDGLLSVEEGYDKAERAANKAIEIEPASAVAHSTLATVAAYRDGDLRQAAHHYQIVLDSAGWCGCDFLYLEISDMLFSVGRVQEAITYTEKVLSKDPEASWLHFNLGLQYLYVGRFADAEQSMARAVTLNPGMIEGSYRLGEARLLLGRAEEALRDFEQEPDSLSKKNKGLAMAHYALGNIEESDEALTRFIEEVKDEWQGDIAEVYAFRGEYDQAFEWLAGETADSPGWAIGRSSPHFRSLHDDPRWHEFLERIEKTDEDLAAIEFEVHLVD